jgi:P4 family phage/plasmid primase-like protien
MYKFKTFLQSYKKNNTNILTHTTYGDIFSNGSYSIPESDYDKIYNYIVCKYNKNIIIPLVERIPTNMIKHFMIDLDLHYNIKKDPTIDELNLFCKLFIQTIKNYTNYSKDTCTIYIQQRANGYFCSKTKIYKSGVHLIIPDFISHTDVQHFIRNEMIKIINRNKGDDIFINEDIEDNIHDIIFNDVCDTGEDIIDKCVINSNGFYIYGCGKIEHKSVYLVSNIFKYNMNTNIGCIEPFNMDVNIDNIKFFSQRKDYTGLDIFKLKDKYIKQNTIPTITNIEKNKIYIKVFNIKKLFNAEAAEYYYLLQNIRPTRFDNYNDWFRILVILKTANISFDMFNEFSSKSYKYKGSDYCLDEWNSVNIKDVDKKLSIATLYEWFKTDNELQFYFFQNLINNAINISSHATIADLYIEIVKNNNNMNKYIYNSDHSQWFYISKNNIWVASGKAADPDLLKHDIKNVLFNLFQRKLNYIETLINNNNDKIKNINNINYDNTSINTIKQSDTVKNDIYAIEQIINSLNNDHKKIIKILKQVGTASESRSIIDYLRGSLTKNEITLASFNLNHIFACNNMLFDSSIVNEHIVGWRNIMPEDMVMHTTGYDYQIEPLIEEQIYIMKFINSLFDSKEITEYLLHNIALSLNGTITNRKFFNIFTGNSNNGKSLLFTFLLRVFGKYGYSMSSDIFTCLSKDPNSANVVLYGLIGIRLAILSELEENAVIYTKLIKSITGADPQTVRPLYGKLISFIPQCFIGLLCNALPKFYDSSDAMNTRNKVIKFPFTFGDIDDGKFKKLADHNLDHNLKDDKMYIAMLQILSQLYITNYSKNKNELIIPNSVHNDTQEYNVDNDDVVKWFLQYYDVIDKSPQIKACDLYGSFIRDTGLQNISHRKMALSFQNKLKLYSHKTREGQVYNNIKRKDGL